MPNKCVMDVKILKECGYEESLLAIATNKKKYDRDMTHVAQHLSKAGGGHDKFLEMIHLWLDMTTCRSIWQQFDTYRVGVTKSSESTHHMLIEDVLNTCIDYNNIELFFNLSGYNVNAVKLPSRVLPTNATALLISKLNKDVLTVEDVQEFMEKYLVISDPTIEKIDASVLFEKLCDVLKDSFKIDYDKYYAMFEGGSDSITKETVDIMVDLAMSLDDNRYEKLHKLKRMLPEGFLQRRVVCLNYKALRNMIQQRFTDPFNHWKMFIFKIITQCEHPEFFDDILKDNNTSLSEFSHNTVNGKQYMYGE
jgi:hypothetical protein